MDVQKFITDINKGYVNTMADTNIDFIQGILDRIDCLATPETTTEAVKLQMIKDDLRALISINDKAKNLL